MNGPGDGIGQVLEIAGSGAGATARIRRWSVVFLALAAVIGAAGLYFLVAGYLRGATRLDAAWLEAGNVPEPFQPGWMWIELDDRSHYVEIAGRLRESETLVAPWRRTKVVYAPIVSPGLDWSESATVYLAASEADYARARASNRFSGRLYRGLEPTAQAMFAARGRPVPQNSWTLRDKGGITLAINLGESLIVVALVLAVLAAIGLSIAARRADDVG